LNDVARATAFLEQRGLGPVERRVQLRGSLDVGAGERHRAELCLTESGLYVAAAADREHGVAIDLLRRHDVRYEVGRLHDRLVVGERELGVPPGKGESARVLFALARHRPSGAARPPRARHIEASSEIEQVFLASWLAADELLLAWLPSSTELAVDSPFSRLASGKGVLALTDRRLGVVALSMLGDARVELVERVGVERRSARRARIRAGSIDLEAGPIAARAFEEIAPATALAGSARVLEVARLNWIIGEQHRPFARRLLEVLAQRGDVRARLVTFLVWAELGESDALAPDLAPAADHLAEAGDSAPDPRELVDLWRRWELSARAARRLVDALRALGAIGERWALALHGAARDQLVAETGDLVAVSRADLDLADHLLVAGERERARQLIDQRLTALPSEGLGAWVDTESVDSDLRACLIRAYELLGRTGEPLPEVRALAELARLEPLDLERLRSLEQVAEADLAERAREARVALDAEGLVVSAEHSEPPPPPCPLSAASIRRSLPHPLVREGEIFGKLPALLALVPVPDHGVLRDYCERLSPRQHGAAARGLEDACHVLGVPGVQSYVSRGSKAIGVRAYESTPHFVLVGGLHLDESEYSLSEAELRFAIAAEIAHLRYGHARVTSSEIWAGALSKTRDGLDVALGLLPVLKGWRLADGMGRMVQRVPTDAVKRALGTALRWRRRTDHQHGAEAAPDRGISAINEDLIAAHRVMQLTADRAGLLLTADLVAALRSMLLVRPDYRAIVRDAEQVGLAQVLSRRDAEGRLMQPDLAARVAALIAFHLSDDYARLRDEVWEGGS
jgi:hypothetical protein